MSGYKKGQNSSSGIPPGYIWTSQGLMYDPSAEASTSSQGPSSSSQQQAYLPQQLLSSSQQPYNPYQPQYNPYQQPAIPYQQPSIPYQQPSSRYQQPSSRYQQPSTSASNPYEQTPLQPQAYTVPSQDVINNHIPVLKIDYDPESSNVKPRKRPAVQYAVDTFYTSGVSSRVTRQATGALVRGGFHTSPYDDRNHLTVWWHGVNQTEASHVYEDGTGTFTRPRP